MSKFRSIPKVVDAIQYKTFLPDPKWVNDYATAQVIRALKRRIDELESAVTTPEQIAERAGITVEELYTIVKREITK